MIMQKNGINLVLFIFKKGRCTPEEKKVFDFIVQHFSKQISAVCALVTLTALQYHKH